MLFPKEFGQGFGDPVLILLTEPKQFQKQFGSVFAEQELPQLIEKIMKFGSVIILCVMVLSAPKLLVLLLN